MDFIKRPIQRGYTNRILCVDLGSGAITARSLMYRCGITFWEGAASASICWHKATSSETKALDPGNPLIIANGPLGGIPQFPGTAKGNGRVPVSSHRDSRSLQFRRTLWRLSEICRIRCPAGHRESDAQRNACYRRLCGEGERGGRPQDDEAFSLEQDLVERFTAAGFDKRHIAFLFHRFRCGEHDVRLHQQPLLRRHQAG